MKYLLATLSLLVVGTSCAEAPKIAESKSSASYKAELFTGGIEIPWGMAWLDQDTIIATDRKGELRIIKNGKLETQKVSGLPEIIASGQGGLLDVEVDPDFANNSIIYFSYSGTEGKAKGNNTSVMKAKLDGFKLTDQLVIFNGEPNTDKRHHYGSRLEFGGDGKLYISVGDRGQRDVNPQRLDRDAGKIHRINSDGSIPSDNPYVDNDKANSTIYSYGHRNPQGMAKHPKTGEIWTHEHGPKGGDEINIIQPAKNYGWPVITYGVNYSGTAITNKTEQDGMMQPSWYWVPSIAPSGMTFVTSDKYPHWKGKLLVGSLKFDYLVLLSLNGNEVVSQETVVSGIGRVRSVKQGADGNIYVGVDGKGILKVSLKTTD